MRTRNQFTPRSNIHSCFHNDSFGHSLIIVYRSLADDMIEGETSYGGGGEFLKYDTRYAKNIITLNYKY